MVHKSRRQQFLICQELIVNNEIRFLYKEFDGETTIKEIVSFREFTLEMIVSSLKYLNFTSTKVKMGKTSIMSEGANK